MSVQNYYNFMTPVTMATPVEADVLSAARDLLDYKYGSQKQSAQTLSAAPTPYARRNVAKVKDEYRLAGQVFAHFYPPGTSVKLNKKVFQIVGSPDEDGRITIQSHQGSFQVPVALLKPVVNRGDQVLFLDEKFGVHALAIVDDNSRGNYKLHWVDDFGDQQLTSKMQNACAMARIIPCPEGKSIPFVPKTEDYEMSDGSSSSGSVWNLLK